MWVAHVAKGIQKMVWLVWLQTASDSLVVHLGSRLAAHLGSSRTGLRITAAARPLGWPLWGWSGLRITAAAGPLCWPLWACSRSLVVTLCETVDDLSHVGNSWPGLAMRFATLVIAI